MLRCKKLLEGDPWEESTPFVRTANVNLPRAEIAPSYRRSEEILMSWTTPVVVEICAGLEVTAYLTAEI